MTTLDYRRDRAGGVNGAAQVNGTRRRGSSLATVDSAGAQVAREREERDWYVEPADAVRGLFELQRFAGTGWDPACGGGTITRTAREFAAVVQASDIVRRDPELPMVEHDFLAPSGVPFWADYIVCNPPFALAEPFLRRALDLAMVSKVALLLRWSWAEGRGRRWVWDSTPLAWLHPFAGRVSMPPGGAAVRAKGGAVAFAWWVWDKSHPIGTPPMVRRIERAIG